jgi:hypothetical protein
MKRLLWMSVALLLGCSTGCGSKEEPKVESAVNAVGVQEVQEIKQELKEIKQALQEKQRKPRHEEEEEPKVNKSSWPVAPFPPPFANRGGLGWKPSTVPVDKHGWPIQSALPPPDVGRGTEVQTGGGPPLWGSAEMASRLDELRKEENARLRQLEAAREKAKQSPSTPKGSSGGPVHVQGYTRSNGTFVQPHTRSAPGTGSHHGGGRK